MKCNVGGYDMAARLIIGTTLLLAGLLVPMATGWKIVVFVVAAIALVTGIVRYCPINAMLGMNSCTHKDRTAHT